MSKPANLQSTLGVLWKWRKPIIYCTAIATIGTIIISLLLPNYYKATTIFYPANQELTKPSTIRLAAGGVSYLGHDGDVDRFISIVNSNELVDSMVQRFDLYDRYDIDPSSNQARTKIRSKFRKLSDIKKTKYGTTEISVEDKEPEVATEMANAVRDFVNDISWRIIKDSQKKVLKSYEDTFEEGERYLQLLTDSLTDLKNKFEIYAIGGQGKSLIEARAEVQEKYEVTKSKFDNLKSNPVFRDSLDIWNAEKIGFSRQIDRLNRDLGKYNDGVAQVVSLETFKREFWNQLTVDKDNYHKLKNSNSGLFKAIHVLEYAEIPDRKSRPKRSIYVIGAFLFAFIFSVIAALLFETYKRIDWKNVMNVNE